MDLETSGVLVKRTLALVPRHLPLVASLLDEDLQAKALKLPQTSDGAYERHVAQLQGSALDTQHFDFVLPVAGTWIDSQSLTGSWSANVFVAGVSQQTLTFDIEP